MRIAPIIKETIFYEVNNMGHAMLTLIILQCILNIAIEHTNFTYNLLNVREG